jgi:hypothetical protein
MSLAPQAGGERAAQGAGCAHDEDSLARSVHGGHPETLGAALRNGKRSSDGRGRLRDARNEATYSCVDPLDSSFGLSITPLGYDGNPVTYTYDAASRTLHLYNAYGTGYGTPGNPRMYEEILVLQ